MPSPRPLKRDALGAVILDQSGRGPVVARDFEAARSGWAWLARALGRREARALARLDGVAGVPALIAVERGRLVRSFLPGRPMFDARPVSPLYFREARRLLRRIHRAGVAHNDLAKEANWLCLPGHGCGIVDFQLALVGRRRSALFRLLAREDLRHLLKHKRHYLPDALTARERAILASPAFTARAWRVLVKPVYLFVTRRLFAWPERTGAEERQLGYDVRPERPPHAHGRLPRP